MLTLLVEYFHAIHHIKHVLMNQPQYALQLALAAIGI